MKLKLVLLSHEISLYLNGTILEPVYRVETHHPFITPPPPLPYMGMHSVNFLQFTGFKQNYKVWGGGYRTQGGGSNLHVTPGLGPLPNLAMMPGSDQHYKHHNVELL